MSSFVHGFWWTLGRQMAHAALDIGISAVVLIVIGIVVLRSQRNGS